MFEESNFQLNHEEAPKDSLDYGNPENNTLQDYEYPAPFWGRDVKEGEAKDFFNHLLNQCLAFKKEGNDLELNKFAKTMYNTYFNTSSCPFDYLPMEEAFEFLIQINKIKELRGPIGQSGVDSIAYNLASFQIDSEDRGGKEIHNFIKNLLHNKSTSQQVEALLQLQTIAASALASSEWSAPVYSAILSFLQQEALEDVYLVSVLKRRITQTLTNEIEDPTMSFITTINNSHRAVMFENLVSEEEKICSDKILNQVNFIGSGHIKHVIPISSDQYGIYDQNSVLIGIFPKNKLAAIINTKENNSSQTPDWNTYRDIRQYFQPRVPAGEKLLALIRNNIVFINDYEKLEIIASHLNVNVVWLSDALEVFQKLTLVDSDGLSRDENELINDLEACINQELPNTTYQELDDYLTNTFKEKYYEKRDSLAQASFEPLDTPETKLHLEYLGLTEKDQVGLSIFEDPFFRQNVEKTFGVQLQTLDFRIQMSILKFISTKTPKYVEHITHHIRQIENEENRRNAFITLVANEQFEDVASLIELLSSDEELAASIYQKYTATITSLDEITIFLEQHFKKPVDAKTITHIRESLIHKATRNLIQQKNAIKTIIEKSWDDQTEESLRAREDIVREIQKISHETFFLLETFKVSKKLDPELRLEDIAYSQFQTMIPAQDIDMEIRAQMIAMYAKNHENESGAEVLIEKFKAGFKNKDRHLYTFSYNGNLLSFIAFDAQNERRLYASAFNVAPDARGYKIGEAMMDQALNEQARENALTADCIATLPISAKYIESGFLGTHFYMDGTDPVLDIVRNDSILHTFTTRSLSPQQILTQTLMQPIQQDIEMYTVASQKEVSFEPLSRGFILTRYLVDKNTGRTHIVFEKPTVDITQWSEVQLVSDRKAG